MEESESPPARTVIGGRHGSPSLTIALPFSKITSVDSELREAVADMAALLARLATATDPDERESIAAAAKEIAERVGND